MHDRTTEPVQQRCAIYTRKSTGRGLEQEFNSLETQRAICSAYVTSQAHKGWLESPKHYDDGGRTGANLDRPQLQSLMADIENGMIDIVLVYKLDRISRSLLDFVRLMDFFERFDVTFVSITQNFDTSDSMGRLILNVLLTFAQFEREIMADRMRDKQRLMRQSGRWAGGNTPLGYRNDKHHLRIIPLDAAKVRFMFEKFAELGTYEAVAAECRKAGITGRRRRDRNGVLGPPKYPCTGTLHTLLGNATYIGLLRSGDEWFQGQHEPLIEKALWDRVQAIRDKLQRSDKKRRHKADLLFRILFDHYGRLMSRHYTARNGWFNDYYASLQNEWGRRHGQARIWVRAEHLERLVCAALQDLLSNKPLVRMGLIKAGCFDRRLEELSARTDSAARKVGELKHQELRQLIHSVFLRLELRSDRIIAVIRWRSIERFLAWDGKGLFKTDEAEWSRAKETHVLDIPFSTSRGHCRPRPRVSPVIAGRPAPRLVRLIHEAREAQALQDASPEIPLEELARKMHCKDRYFERLLRLNYLAPDIVAAILKGTQPLGLTRKALAFADLPLDWALQRRMLGFSPDPQ